MNRETIATALLTLIQSATIGSAPAFVEVDRRYKTWDECHQKPAAFLQSPHENYVRPDLQVPRKVTLSYDLFVYVDTGTDPNFIPDTQINNIMDALDAAFEPPWTTAPANQLGGLVTNCWIEGDVLRSSVFNTGQAIIIVPIKVLVPA